MNVYAITNAQGETYSTYDVNKKLEDAGIPDEVIERGEDAIETYAQENGITLPTSEKQEEKPQPKLNGSGDSAKTDYMWQLKAAGIPESIISQGNSSVQQYAQEHNIVIPTNSTGTNFNLSV